ncbi:MAG: PD-(D/E)XK nuclease family protein [Bacteroidales bacterium]|nr:PD-(D/E)XK nuclease family protein [Bacteroidales bacterium]
MKTFLGDVAKYLFDRAGGDLRNVTVVFPNRRARLFFNNYVSDIIDKPVWSPQFYTISEFIGNLSDLQLADPLTLIFKLFEVYKVVTGSNETFDNFYYYCETILADFDDIDKNMVDADQLYTNLSDLKSIEGYFEYLNDEQIQTIKSFWQTLSVVNRSDEQTGFITLWDAIRKIYIKFNQLLDSEGIAYEGKIYKHAITSLKNLQQLPYSDKLLAFVGFNALNKTEEVLFKKYKTAGNALFFWDYDMRYISSDIHEAGYFLKHYLRSYPPPPDFVSQVNTDKEISIKSFSVPTNISQSKILKECLQEVEKGGSEDPSKTAVILADEKLLLPVVNSIPASVQHVNISMGYPVLDTPAYNLIALLTDLQLNSRKGKDNKGKLFYHKDYFAILNHSYLRDIRGNDKIAQLIENAKDRNIIYIDPLSIDISDELYSKIFTIEVNTKNFGNYLLEIIRQIARNETLKKENKDRKWQLEVLHGIYKVISRFSQQLQETSPDFSFSTILKLIKKVLKGITIPFSGEPLIGLQIMGILETRTLDFENVIILSMNEGKFPKSGNVPSMIPYNLREGFQLPTIKHQDAIYAYHFYRLLHRSKNVFLVHHTRSEGIQKGEPSRYIYQLKYDSPFNITEVNYRYTIYPFTKKEISVKKTSEIIAKLDKYLKPGGGSFLSPSALNTYLSCSLRFYFKYIEGLEEAENIEEDIEADVFGSIVHSAMEFLYKDLQNKVLISETINEIIKDKTKVKEAVDRAFGKEYFGDVKLNKEQLRGRNLIVKRVIERYIYGILHNDMNYAPFVIKGLEQFHSREIELGHSNRNLAIGGIIDRIDEKDGVFRIVDYKTGRTHLNFKDVNDLFFAEPQKRNAAAFQIFTYSWIVKKNIINSNLLPSLIFIRDIFKPEFNYKLKITHNRKSIPVESFNDFAGEFEISLKNVVNEIYDVDLKFTQTPDIGYCASCPYNEICIRRS